MATVSPAHVLVVAGSLACVAACKKEQPRAVPQPVGIEGANCYSAPCNPGLVCTPASRMCAKPDHPEILAAQAADREREKAFLSQSGVEPSRNAEQPPPSPATPTAAGAPIGAVRVVRTKNKGDSTWVIAACRADERLIGGGCTQGEGNWLSVPGYPSGESAADTVGARWNCGWKNPGASSLTIEAFALCQRL